MKSESFASADGAKSMPNSRRDKDKLWRQFAEIDFADQAGGIRFLTRIVKDQLEQTANDCDLIDLMVMPIPCLDHSRICRGDVGLTEARKVWVVGSLDFHQAATIVRQKFERLNTHPFDARSESCHRPGSRSPATTGSARSNIS